MPNTTTSTTPSPAQPMTVQTTPSVHWNEAALAAIRTTHPGPPMVARALFMLHAAMFDAWAAHDRSAVGLHWKVLTRRPAPERTEARRREAMSYAAYRVLSDLFPGEQATFDTALSAVGLDAAQKGTDPATPAGVGNLAAAELLADRHADGSNQQHGYADTTGYAPVNTPDTVSDPGRWQPLRVSDGHGGFKDQKFIAPHWRLVTPFALKRPDQFRPAPPTKWGTPAFAAQVQEIVAYSANLTPEQKAVAEYWADGPSSELPPGHWTLFATFVSARDGHSTDDDARMFFAMTGAVMDASVSCWEAKTHYDYVRPVTAVRELLRGQTITAWAGAGRDHTPMLADEWRPYQAITVVTPPFAEYTSGHSTFSAAAAAVLQLFTHSDTFGHSVTLPAGGSRVEDGQPAAPITLSWPTFSAAADEAGISRRYGGIHFHDGDLAGRAAGREIGRQAYLRALHHFNPKLHPTW